jgi:hypothetical protein
LASGHTERVLPDVPIAQYDLSPDGNAIAYEAMDASLWYALVDRRTPPRKLAPQGIYPVFSPSGDVLFRNAVGSILYLIHPDGTGLRAVPGNPGDPEKYAVSPFSPDGKWSTHIAETGLTMAYPSDGGRPVPLCDGCYMGWSRDGKFFWITLYPLTGQNNIVTGLFALKKNSMLPSLPREAIQTQADLMKIPGVVIVPFGSIAPSPDGSSYAFVKQESRWNLYRITLP